MAGVTGWSVTVRGLLTAAVAAALGPILGRALRHAGATRAEVTATLPGDERLPRPTSVSTRATTLPRPPGAVWPWLVQLGFGRAGWYALDELEALVGVACATADDGTTSWRSLDHVAQRHQGLAVGDPVPLSPSSDLVVVALEEQEHLVLELDAGGGAWRFQWCWAFVLRPLPGGRARLLVRTRVAARPVRLAALVRVLLDPGHGLMELVQLRNLRRRVAGWRRDRRPAAGSGGASWRACSARYATSGRTSSCSTPPT